MLLLTYSALSYTAPIREVIDELYHMTNIHVATRSAPFHLTAFTGF